MLLQLFAPFIHAHAFGLDSHKTQTFHMHYDSAYSDEKAFNQIKIGENQNIGAITTLAKGVKTSLADDIYDSIAALAIFFTIALFIFNVFTRFVKFSEKILQPFNYFQILQNPRAPPY